MNMPEELREDLAVFVDHWGMDSYHPPEAVVDFVRGLVATRLSVGDPLAPIYNAVHYGSGPACIVKAAIEAVKPPHEHAWQEHDVYGEECTKCGEHRK